MKRRQILASGLSDDAELVIGHHLEQRLGQPAQALDLICRRAMILRLVVTAHGVDSLLNQRLAGFDHSNKGALVHAQFQCSVGAV